MSDWRNFMFTDESRFTLEPDDKCLRIWPEKGTGNQPQNITTRIPRQKHYGVGRDYIRILHRPEHLSAAIVRRRLHMSGLYAQAPRLFFSIRPIKRGTMKVVPGTCHLDCV